MIKGIDVSDNNGKIDWQAVKESGIEFAIIRLGFGNDDTSQDDRRFEENVAGCEAAGIPWGAYIYSYAMNTAEALSEAQHCLRLLEGKRPAYPVCFDMEDADGYKKRHGGLSGDMAVSICDTFLSYMEQKGYYVCLYASLSYLTGILNDRRLDRYDKWVAQWNNKCDYTGSYGLWQYGGSTNYLESVYLSGISGAVDKNAAYYDYPAVIKENGLNGWPKPNKPAAGNGGAAANPQDVPDTGTDKDPDRPTGENPAETGAEKPDLITETDPEKDENPGVITRISGLIARLILKLLKVLRS